MGSAKNSGAGVMRRAFHIFLIMLSVSGSTKAQSEYWEHIPIGGRIVTGGAFDYSANLDMSIYTGVIWPDSGNKFIAGYNGSEWVHLTDTASTGFRTFVDFQDGILVGGSMPYLGTQNIPYAAYFDGNEWSYPFVFNGSVSKLRWVNDTLFALGHFTEIDGIPAYKIARLVDGVWEGMLQPYDDLIWTMFADIVFFEGEYYVGGNFESAEGPDDFAILRDGMLHEVGQGLTGSWTTIGSLEVFQDDLYLFGNIPQIQGNIGDHILRWDGENYHALAGPFLDANGNQSVAGAGGRLMKVRGDYLYICGTFTYIEGVEMNFFARWDGTQWCGLYTNHFIDWMPDFEFINGELIIVTPDQSPDDPSIYEQFFKYLGGDDVSECSLPLSTESQFFLSEITIYPNPVFQSGGSEVSITSSVNFSEISVFDLAGRLVLQERMALTSQHSLRLQGMDFGPGVYIVRLGGDGQWGSYKMVVLD